MKSTESIEPWLEYEEREEEHALLANRQGFVVLREGIDQILSGADGTVYLEMGSSSLRLLELSTHPAQPLKATLTTRILLCFLAAFVGFSLLLGLGFLLTGAASLFSILQEHFK